MRAIATRIAFAAAAVAASAALSTPAAAQHAAAATVRPVATYEFVTGRRSETLPSRVVVADSAGTLVANAWYAGVREARPLAVAVDGTDLLLGADTPRGALQLKLRQPNGRESQGAIGRWTLGRAEGAIRGKH